MIVKKNIEIVFSKLKLQKINHPILKYNDHEYNSKIG